MLILPAALVSTTTMGGGGIGVIEGKGREQLGSTKQIIC